MNRLVIGIGNSFRRDDGVGPAVAAEVARLELTGVDVLTATGEPGELIDAWGGVPLAVIVDAAAGDGAAPGTIRRWTPGHDAAGTVSSHALGLPATYALAHAIGRLPDELVVLTVDIADAGLGVGLSAPVAAAVPDAVDAVLAEFGLTHHGDLRRVIKD